MKFKVGDKVRATGKLWRKDMKTVLEAGDAATVTHVFQVDENSPQIIGLAIPGKKPIGDIVCSNAVPLLKI